MSKIIAAALALSLMSVSYVVAQATPTTQEECEKVDGKKWDSEKNECVSK